MRTSWRWWAVGLLAAAIFTLTLFSALILRRSYLETYDRVHAQALASAHVVGGHIGWILGASQAFREIDRILGPDVSASAQIAASEIRQAIDAMPIRAMGWIVDANGTPVFSTRADLPSLSIADRPYFEELKSSRQPLIVTPLIVGRASGENVFLVAYRLQREGRFAGAIMITFPASIMSDFRKTLDLGEGRRCPSFAPTAHWSCATRRRTAHESLELRAVHRLSAAKSGGDLRCGFRPPMASHASSAIASSRMSLRWWRWRRSPLRRIGRVSGASFAG